MINPMRIGGLATGMDTDALVKQIMDAERIKVDRVKQQRDTLKDKQEVYRDLMKDFRGLHDKYLSLSSNSEDCLISSKAYKTVKFESSNSAAVTATGYADSRIGNYKVKVDKVATKAKVELVESDIKDKTIEFKVNNKSVKITFTNKKQEEEDFQKTVNQGTNKAGEYVVFAKDSNEMIKKINNVFGKEGMKAKASYSEISKKIMLETNDTGKDQSIEVECSQNKQIAELDFDKDIKGKHLTKKINGIKLDIDANTINPKTGTKIKHAIDIIDIIKDKLKGSNIQAELDLNNKIIFKAKTIKDNGENIEGTVTDSFGNTSELSALNKIKNNFTIDGVNFSIHGTTNGEVNLSGRTDEDSTKKLKDNVVKFINEYNKIIDKTYTKISEKKQFKYKPLTEEQRKAMDKDDIKRWDEKVKQGLIKNDSDFSSMLNKMINAFSQPVQGAGISLKDIGIDFSKNYKKPGQLVIDESKLDKALQENGDRVKQFLTQTSDNTDKDQKLKEEGILIRLKDIMYDNVVSSGSNLMKKAGFEGNATAFTNNLSKQMQEKEKTIFEMEKVMSAKENALYLKFSRLETAMNKLNQQQSYFMQQLGGGR